MISLFLSFILFLGGPSIFGGSVGTVRGPGPQWGSADRGLVFSGYPLLLRITDKLLQNKILAIRYLKRMQLKTSISQEGYQEKSILPK